MTFVSALKAHDIGAMNGSDVNSDDALRTRLKNNSNLCDQFARVMSGSLIVRMSQLASELIVDLFDAQCGQAVDKTRLKELSQLVWEDNASDMQNATHVLAHKNLVLFAEAIMGKNAPGVKGRIRERSMSSCKDSHSSSGVTEGYSPPSHKQDNMKMPKIEKQESKDPILDLPIVGLTTPRNRKNVSYEEKKRFTLWQDDGSSDHSSRKPSKSPASGSVSGSKIAKRAPVKRTPSVDAMESDSDCDFSPKKKRKSRRSTSPLVRNDKGKMVSAKYSQVQKECWIKRKKNKPPSRLAVAFGLLLESDSVECPYCKVTIDRATTLDYHIKAMHEKDRVSVFGCPKCDVWCCTMGGAKQHHESLGCTLTMRSVAEAKKWEGREEKPRNGRSSRASKAPPPAVATSSPMKFFIDFNALENARISLDHLPVDIKLEEESDYPEIVDHEEQIAMHDSIVKDEPMDIVQDEGEEEQETTPLNMMSAANLVTDSSLLADTAGAAANDVVGVYGMAQASQTFSEGLSESSTMPSLTPMKDNISDDSAFFKNLIDAAKAASAAALTETPAPSSTQNTQSSAQPAALVGYRIPKVKSSVSIDTAPAAAASGVQRAPFAADLMKPRSIICKPFTIQPAASAVRTAHPVFNNQPKPPPPLGAEHRGQSKSQPTSSFVFRPITKQEEESARGMQSSISPYRGPSWKGGVMSFDGPNVIMPPRPPPPPPPPMPIPPPHWMPTGELGVFAPLPLIGGPKTPPRQDAVTHLVDAIMGRSTYKN